MQWFPANFSSHSYFWHQVVLPLGKSVWHVAPQLHIAPLKNAWRIIIGLGFFVGNICRKAPSFLWWHGTIKTPKEVSSDSSVDFPLRPVRTGRPRKTHIEAIKLQMYWRRLAPMMSSWSCKKKQEHEIHLPWTLDNCWTWCNLMSFFYICRPVCLQMLLLPVWNSC